MTAVYRDYTFSTRRSTNFMHGSMRADDDSADSSGLELVCNTTRDSRRGNRVTTALLRLQMPHLHRGRVIAEREMIPGLQRLKRQRVRF